jgi:hypothetical protein
VNRFIALLALASSAAAFADGPNPNEFYVNTIKYNGSGCPLETVSPSISDDGKAFTLTFGQYIAEVGPGVALTESRKNCQLDINLHIPQGWAYTITNVDYRGYARLDPNVVGTQKSTYYFMGNSMNSANGQSTYVGPFEGDYGFRDTLAFNTLVWSRCGVNRNLEINTQVRLDNSRNRRGTGMMTVDSIDGEVKQIYHLQWMRCQ